MKVYRILDKTGKDIGPLKHWCGTSRLYKRISDLVQSVKYRHSWFVNNNRFSQEHEPVVIEYELVEVKRIPLREISKCISELKL